MQRINSGFTLIELIIVIVLASILAATTIPKLFSNGGTEQITVQDQLIAILRRMQTQAMQQTNIRFEATDNAAIRAPFCHELVVTTTQLGMPDQNPCAAETVAQLSAGATALTATAANSPLHFSLPAQSEIILSLYDSAAETGSSGLPLPFVFKFNALGQPVRSASDATAPLQPLAAGLRIDISATVKICIESEGYVHPCAT